MTQATIVFPALIPVGVLSVRWLGLVSRPCWASGLH